MSKRFIIGSLLSSWCTLKFLWHTIMRSTRHYFQWLLSSSCNLKFFKYTSKTNIWKFLNVSVFWGEVILTIIAHVKRSARSLILWQLCQTMLHSVSKTLQFSKSDPTSHSYSIFTQHQLNLRQSFQKHFCKQVFNFASQVFLTIVATPTCAEQTWFEKNLISWCWMIFLFWTHKKLWVHSLSLSLIQLVC